MEHHLYSSPRALLQDWAEINDFRIVKPDYFLLFLGSFFTLAPFVLFRL